METLRPGSFSNNNNNSGNDILFEEIEEEVPDSQDEAPVYIESNNPEEAYHKFLLAEQSNFEEALQKQAEDDGTEDANDESEKNDADIENKDGFVESIDNFEKTTVIPSTNDYAEVEDVADVEAGEHYPEGAHVTQAEGLFRKSLEAEVEEDVIKPVVVERQHHESVSENSEIARIQDMDEEKDEASHDNFGESQQFVSVLGDKKEETKQNMQFEKSMEFEQDDFNNTHDQAQLEMYTKTLRASSTEPPKPKSRASSIHSIKRVASSTDFQRSTLYKRPNSTFMGSSSNFASLTSTNDFKYMGDQFKVGKTNPNLQSSCEKRFQKLYSKQLSYLYTNSQRSLIPEINNDNKYTGMQFRMGKFTSPAIADSTPTYEQRFQAMFKPRLEVLKPKPKPRSLTYLELKELHSSLLPVRPY